MEKFGYMLRMASIISRLSEIDRGTFNLLSIFTFHSHLSIYQINKMSERFGKKIAYKNTHKKVQKLIKLKLIERETDSSKLSDRDSERGAKYYKLSEEGIFVLFYAPDVFTNTNNNWDILNAEQKNIEDYEVQYKIEIYKNHKDCNFFRFFISPWISLNTIENLGEGLTIKIQMFLKNCCSIVKDKIISLSAGFFHSYGLSKNVGSRHERESQYIDLSSINEGGTMVDDSNLFLFIRKIFSLDLDIVKVKKIDKNHIIVTKSDDAELFQLNYKEDQNELDIISINDNMNRVSLPANLTNGIRIPSILFDYLVDRIDLSSLYFNAVSSIIIEKIDENDLRLLKEDLAFKNKLVEVYNRLHYNYNILNK